MSNNRTELANKSMEWYLHIMDKYSEQIDMAIDGTVVNHPVPSGEIYEDSKMSLYKTDTVSALFAGKRVNPRDRYCVLNFASYTQPGGGFLSGSVAQEEALCRESILYPVLKSFDKEWYQPHRDFPVEGYSSVCLLTPGVLFIRGQKQVIADVMTVAAVNHKALFNMSRADAYKLMCGRMEYAYKCMNSLGASRVILGAWGCGVFGNDPATIAGYWKEIYEADKRRYKEVVHAVPDVSTYTEFRKVMK